MYIIDPEDWARVYTPELQAEVESLVSVLSPVMSADQVLSRPDLLGQVDIILSGWGGPKFDKAFLELAPQLQAVFYGAGAVRYMLTEHFWEREIVLPAANIINAIPVAEFSLAHILLGMNRAWAQTREVRNRRTFAQLPVPGAYRSTVGLISMSTIGRLVLQHLEHFDMHVVAYDPTLSEEEALELGVELVSLEELFSVSDVVSLHAPLIPETEGLITGTLLANMKHGATFINTSRGSIVRETEMIEVLCARPDLIAVLDVTDPEPPVANSPPLRIIQCDFDSPYCG